MDECSGDRGPAISFLKKPTIVTQLVDVLAECERLGVALLRLGRPRHPRCSTEQVSEGFASRSGLVIG